MRIAIDLLFLRPGKVGGTEFYVRNLIKGLGSVDDKNEYFLLLSKDNESSFESNLPNFLKVVCGIRSRNKFLRILYENTILLFKLKKYKIEIVFFPTYIRPIWRLKIFSISNIHDLQYLHYPEYFSLLQKIVFRIFYPVTINKSDVVIAISDFVRQDILDKFKAVDNISSKVKLLYIPIDFQYPPPQQTQQAILQKRGLKGNDYLFTVSSLLPHKNLITLLKAFSLLKNEYSKPIKLVISGISGSKFQELILLVKSLNVEEDVLYTGFITNEERATLYCNAKIFVFPSIFEGFGMPPVEAMRFGVPVVVSDIPVMREVTQNKVIYVPDFNNPNAWFTVLLEIMEGKLKYSISESERKVFYDEYSLENIARQYISLFQSCIVDRGERI